MEARLMPRRFEGIDVLLSEGARVELSRKLGIWVEVKMCVEETGEAVDLFRGEVVGGAAAEVELANTFLPG